MHELFNEEIEKEFDNYNIIQLSDWIRKCRLAYTIESKEIYQEDYTRFIHDVYIFQEEWKSFADRHKKKYNSKEFYQAQKLSVMPKPKYVIVTSDYAEIDVTEDFEEMQMKNLVSAPLISKSISRVESRIAYYSRLIDKLINDEENKERAELKGVIEYLAFNLVTYKVNLLIKESDFSKKTVKQILSSVKRGKWRDEERKTKEENYETFSAYLIATIRKNHINKNVYYEFINIEKQDKKRVYEKQFLFNVGFYIGLTAKEMESVLKNEGYTMISSKRQDDKLVYDCFNYFFPQQYASALLSKEGYSTLDIG